MEYLLLLGVATAMAMVGFRTLLPKVKKSSEHYFNEAANKLLGDAVDNMEKYRDNYP